MEPKSTPSFKYHVVFFHGVGKTNTSWNESDSGKKIGVETSIATRAHTTLIQVDDFNTPPSVVVAPVIESIGGCDRKVIIVCHSLGIIHTLELLKHKLPVVGVCIIDPPPLDDRFIQVMDTRGWDNIVQWIQEYTFYPTTSICFSVHLDYDGSNQEQFARKVEYYKPLIGANDRSKMVIHPNKGHMIHWTATAKIVRAVGEMMGK